MPETASPSPDPSLLQLPADFWKRCGQNQTEFRADRENNCQENWPIAAGNYGSLEDRVDLAGLSGVEPFIVQHVGDMLARATPEDPAIALDIGGGVGITWLKLAQKFGLEVADGRLILAVTNRMASPERFLHTLQQDRGNRYADPLSAFYRRYRHRVQYMYSAMSAADIPHVTLGSGERVVPYGRTGLVHERYSLSGHSKLPELHVARLGALMSRRGLYMVNSSEYLIRDYEAGEGTHLNEQTHHVLLGRQVLQQHFGMQRVTPTELSVRPYTLFYGAEAIVPPAVHQSGGTL